MYFLNEVAIDKSENITYLIISRVEKAKDIEGLVLVAYQLIDSIISIK